MIEIIVKPKSARKAVACGKALAAVLYPTVVAGHESQGASYVSETEATATLPCLVATGVSNREKIYATNFMYRTRSQYYDQQSHTRHWPGEARLLFAVLEDAVRCVLLRRRSSISNGQLEMAEVMVWVNTRGGHDLFSSDSICAVFEIEPQTLRLRLHSLNSEDRQAERDHIQDSFSPVRPARADSGLLRDGLARSVKIALDTRRRNYPDGTRN